MIPALAWIPKGAAKLKPELFQIDDTDADAMQLMKDYKAIVEVRSAFLSVNHSA